MLVCVQQVIAEADAHVRAQHMSGLLRALHAHHPVQPRSNLDVHSSNHATLQCQAVPPLSKALSEMGISQELQEQDNGRPVQSKTLHRSESAVAAAKAYDLDKDRPVQGLPMLMNLYHFGDCEMVEL